VWREYPLEKKILLTLLLSSFLLIGACSPFSEIPTAKATTPQNDKEAVVSAALMRTIVEQDIPGFDLLTKDPRLPLKNETRFNSDSMIDSLGTGALPPSGGITFILLSSPQIQDIAERFDSFVYLSIPSIRVNGDQATVVLSTVLTARKNNEIVVRHGGWLEIGFFRTGGKWQFDQVLDRSI
jgi:hypothetical protein